MHASFAFDTASWSQLLLQASFQSGVILAVVAVFWLALRRRISHPFSHGLFLLVPARFAAAILCGLLAFEMPVAIPLPGILLPPVDQPAEVPSIVDPPIEPQPVPIVAAEPFETGPAFETIPGIDIPIEPEPDRQETLPTAQPVPVEPIIPPGFEWPGRTTLAFAAWFVVVLGLSCRFLVRTILMRSRLNRHAVSASAQLCSTVAEVSKAMGLRRCPAALITPAVAAPAVFGLIRPKLLIPAGFETDFDDSETHWAIAHELAHLKRRDLWAVAFERCVGLAGFFHPGLWLARRATGTFRELACDDVAARVTGLPPRICAETFLKILVWADRRPHPAPLNPLVLGLNPRYPAIRRRIENMTDQAISKRVVPSWFGYAISALALTAVLPVSPRFVAAETQAVAEAPVAQAPAPASKPGFEIRAVDTATNQPVAKAVVHFQTDRSSGKVETDTNGQASIPFEPGVDDFLSIRIASDSHVPFRMRRSSIEDPDFPPVSPLVAKLQPGMPIGGQVIADEGEVVPNARVLVTYQAKPNEIGSTSYRCEVVRTGPDGRWKTAQVDPNATRIDIAALHPAFAIDWVGTEADPRGRVEPPFENLKAGTHQFRLKSGQTLRGRVLDLEGKPVAGAEVRSDEWPVDFGDAPLLTDAKGEFRIGNLGTVRTAVKIAVHKPGLGWCIKSIDVQDQDRVATFQLIPGRTIKGRVTDTTGKAIADVRIDDTALPRSLVPPDKIRRTDADGRFEIADLPADFISLIFSKTGYAGYEAKIDTVRTATLEVVLGKQPLIEGRVTDAATGQPLENFRVVRIVQNSQSEWVSVAPGRLVDGRFRSPLWRNFGQHDEPFPRYRLRFEAPGFEPFTTDAMNASDLQKPLSIALKRAAPADSKSIEGRVLKPDGTPAAGAAVAIFTPDDGTWPRYEPQFAKGRMTGMTRATRESPPAKMELILTDTDGKFRIPADAAKIGWIVTHDVGVFRSPVAESVNPAEPVTIKLGPYARVHGVFLRHGKPAADVKIWYSVPGVNANASIPIQDTVITDDQGRFAFDRVIPGQIRLAFPHEKMKAIWQHLADPIEVKPGASLKVEASVTEFGHHQLVSEESGERIASSGSGEFANAFVVYGRITDSVTGETLGRSTAYLLTGLADDEIKLSVHYNDTPNYQVRHMPSVKYKSGQTKKMDPWLVVFAPGYEPYVSPRPIPRVKGPVRVDVALKPVPAREPKMVEGQILKADGSPARRATIAFTTKTPALKVGQAEIRWQDLVHPGSYHPDGPNPLETDENGRFRISCRDGIDQLTVMDRTGCAIVTGDDLAKSDGVVRLGPWSRVEGRVEMQLPAEVKVRTQVNYRDVAWSPFLDSPGAAVRPDGTFVIEQVLPGTHSIGLASLREIPNGISSTTLLDPPLPFEAIAGQTAKVTLKPNQAEPEKPGEPNPLSKSADARQAPEAAKPVVSQSAIQASTPADRKGPENPMPSGNRGSDNATMPIVAANGGVEPERNRDHDTTEGSGVRVTLKEAATGKPVAGAEVIAFADNDRTIRSTDATGHITVDFEPSRHHSFSLDIRHPGYVPVQEYRYRQMTKDFPPPREMEIKLTRGQTIGGRVTDPDGKPIADAEVRVEFGMNDDRRLMPCFPVRTDQDGRWTASSIDPACTSVVIQLRHPKFVMGPHPYEIAQRLVFRKPFAELVDRTHVTQMTPGHKFIATVLGPDGNPVEGARAYLSQFSGLLEDSGVASNAAGSIAIENLASLQGAPFRTLRVIVHKPGVGWHTVNLAENQFDKPMTVRLESARKFALRVVDSDGKPIAGARIMSEFLPPEMTIGMKQATNEDGSFEIADFPPGKWRLTATQGGFEGESLIVDAASRNEATLVLQRERLVKGTVKDSVSGKPVESFQVFQVPEDGNPRYRDWIGKGQGDGLFAETLNQRSKWLEGSEPKARLRIEAAGFEAFETEPFLISKPPASFEIALKPDAKFRFVTGKVIGPDGKPAAGAEVAYFTPSVEGERDFVPRIEKGRIVAIFNRPAGNFGSRIPTDLIRTGADGTFRIPAASDQIGMVVTHESGGLRDAEAGPVPNAPVELKLQSFGRIEGQLLIEGKPAASKTLKFEYKFDDGPKEEYLSMPTPVVTDDQGRFEVDHIVPGKVRLRYDTPSGSGLKHYVGGPIPVGAGATTKIRADMDDFGLEESILNDAGQVVSKFALGAKEKAFQVIGYATDAETGQPIEPVLAHLLTGRKGDDVSVQAFMSTIGKGDFETGPMRSKHIDLTKEKIDPYLVVSANGYETYVSPNRIPQANGAVRIDVRLKKVDATKMKTYSGMIRLPDGSPAVDAKVGTTVMDDGIAVGDAKYRWTINENDVQDNDETGKFRIVAPREPDTIFISDKMGFAILKPAEFLEVAGRTPEVKLTPWGRIEGRLTQAGKPVDKLEMTLSYEGVRLPRDQARQDVKVSSDGTFRISSVIARPAKLSIYSKSEQGRFVLVKTVTIECKPGETSRAEIDVVPIEPAAPVKQGNEPQGKAEASPKSADSKTAVKAPIEKPKPEFPAPTGKFISGRVLKPDGTPAAGAEVGFFTTYDDRIGRNDRFLPKFTKDRRIEAIEHRAIVRGQWNNSEREPIRTDAEGRFRMPVWAGKFGWCVTHDAGVLRSTKLVEMTEGETELKLEPWGRIEGTLLLDERPMGEAQLDCQPNFDIGESQFVNPMPTAVRTDPSGRFVVERALPGPYRFSFPNPSSQGRIHFGSNRDMTVPAGGTLKFEINSTMYGWEERMKDESGKVIDRKTFGAMRPGFRVYGQVIDDDTGVPVEPMSAMLVKGAKDEPLDIAAEERPGSVFQVDYLMTGRGPKVLGDIETYLVVIAPGYVPYVSAERFKRGDSPVRHDVRLKKLPPEKTLTLEGQMLDPNGKPPRLGFYDKIKYGEPVRVGEATLNWKFATENPPFAVDHGKFRFTVPKVPGKLVFASQVGFTQLEAADFEKLPGGIVRLEPWGKVRVKVIRNGKTDGNFRFTNSLSEGSKLDFVPSASWYPQEDGSFLLDRLPPIPVEVEIRVPSNQDYRYFRKSVTLHAKPGETTEMEVVVTDEELEEARKILKERQAANGIR